MGIPCFVGSYNELYKKCPCENFVGVIMKPEEVDGKSFHMSVKKAACVSQAVFSCVSDFGNF
jgi:hypothetical protein